MEPAELLEELFDRKMLKVLKTFLNNPDVKFSQRELSRKTRVSLASTHRIVNKLVEIGVVETLKLKKFKAYRLSEGSETKFLEGLIDFKESALDEFVKKIESLENIEKIILHGEAEKEKANVLIIGEGVDETAISDIVVEIKEKYDFKIIHLIIDPVQYRQMNDMGLYPKKKEILFSK